MNSLQSRLQFIKALSPGETKELAEVEWLVREIVSAVRQRGDLAVREYSKRFDKYEGQDQPF